MQPLRAVCVIFNGKLGSNIFIHGIERVTSLIFGRQKSVRPHFVIRNRNVNERKSVKFLVGQIAFVERKPARLCHSRERENQKCEQNKNPPHQLYFIEETKSGKWSFARYDEENASEMRENVVEWETRWKMSERAFYELQNQVETLPFYQIVLLKSVVDKLIEKEKSRESPDFVSEGLDWLDSIAGSIHREIDYDKEKSEWRDEKYGRID